MNSKLEERDWHFLFETLNKGKCTAFVGPGACARILPLGSEIARQWSAKYDSPLPDELSLAEVAQFLSVYFDPIFPKVQLVEQVYRRSMRPDFSLPDEPHAVLASLPISIYITTNYDDFMVDALKHCGKNPKREICRWNDYLKDIPSVFEEQADFKPSLSDPLVFHLHGYSEVPESMVLTEDDHLDFFWNVSKQEGLLPDPIREALSTSSLLFIGYAPRDWSFRVLLRRVVASSHPSLRPISIAQLLVPWMHSEGEQKHIQRYLHDYFGRMNLRIYWGDIATFLHELLARWRETNSERSQLATRARKASDTIAKRKSQQPPTKVFLSYAREDESQANMLYHKLCDAGLNPWMDKHDILPGERWRTCINKAIQECDFFLACISNRAALKRGYLQREFKEALDLWQEKLESDIYLIPVRFDDCDVPENLREFQWVNLFEENGLERLIQAVKTGLKRRGG